MFYFDSMENAWIEDMQIQDDADRRDACLPICTRCGRTIRSARYLYIEEFDAAYCDSCVEAQTEWNEGAEL